MLLDQRPAGFRQLRRDRYDRCIKVLEGVRYLLQSIQLCHAIGSPAAAEHCQDQHPLATSSDRAHLLPKGVLERERRQRIAHFDDAVQNHRCAQVIRGAMHDRPFVSRMRLSAPCRIVSSGSASIVLLHVRGIRVSPRKVRDVSRAIRVWSGHRPFTRQLRGWERSRRADCAATTAGAPRERR